jgi:hypothetical protein
MSILGTTFLAVALLGKPTLFYLIIIGPEVRNGQNHHLNQILEILGLPFGTILTFSHSLLAQQ